MGLFEDSCVSVGTEALLECPETTDFRSSVIVEPLDDRMRERIAPQKV